MSQLGTISLNVLNLNQLKQLHTQIIQNALHRQNYWAAQLINICTRIHAPPPYTSLIFDSTPIPNVYAFTSMLRYYSKSRAQTQALSLFERMKCHDIKPDAYVYPILIKSAGKSGVLFHALVLKLGHEQDRIVRNVIMDMYSKIGPVEIARKLFDEMSDRMVSDWNSMISGYWKWGNEEEACRLFEMMPEKNLVTWTAMVTGYAKVKDLKNARKHFDDMPEKNVVSWNAMLSGYAQNGFTEEALNLFNQMVDEKVRPDETTWVTVISSCSSRGDPKLAESLVNSLYRKGIHLNCFIKTALLDMHAKCGNVETAREIFVDLGDNRNIVSWNAMIAAYTRIGDLDAARELFDAMPEKNIVSWNSMISGYAQNGQSGLAIEVFKEMTTGNDLKPDEVTMVSVISACGHLGALDLGNWVVNYSTHNRIKLGIPGYNSLISMYAKCGNMTEAAKVFRELKERDIVSYNTLIAGYAAHGNGNESIKLYSEMREQGLEPDRVTHIGVLTACSHAGLLEEGRGIFDSIETPSIDHYACMVDLLTRVGKLDDAVKLINSMPMEPHAGVYGSLLHGSRIHKRVDLGEYAANKLFELEPDNSGNYVLLSNMYARDGRWDDVDKVRKRMREVGVSKTTGWSRVEYKGEMVKFIVGDTSHERSDDIYEMLRDVGKRIRSLTGYVADKSCVLRDVEEEEKEEMVGVHSEKLAVCFGLLVSEGNSVIRVVKNLRVCWDCHTAIKMMSKTEKREIIMRDNNRFHHFKHGLCSCHDYW